MHEPSISSVYDITLSYVHTTESVPSLPGISEMSDLKILKIGSCFTPVNHPFEAKNKVWIFLVEVFL